MSTKSATRAAVLAGAVELSAPPPSVLELRVPAIHRVVRSARTPLDLDALRFYYRVSEESIEPVRETHTRACASHRPRPAVRRS